MLRRLAVAISLGVLGSAINLTATNESAAQVRVRAPFVRVDVTPGGGVSVRAPFTAVDVPPEPYYYGPPPPTTVRRPVQPIFPVAEELAAMNDEALRRVLFTTAEQLHARLDRFDTGQTWQRYFRVPDEIFIEPDAAGRLLYRFHSIGQEPQYRMISDLPAFKAMEAVLTEFVSRGVAPGPSNEPIRPRSEELPPPEIPLQPGERSLLNGRIR